METLPDEALVKAVIDGNDRAYEELIRRYQDAVAGFVWRLVPVAEDREEVCQDVFMKAYANLAGFRFGSKFSTWLYTIAHRTAISRMRRKRYEVESFDEEVWPDEAGVDASDEQIARLLNREIGKLDEEERSIISLFHLQGCAVDEISEIVNRPSGTVKSILFRVRKKLKDRLAPQLIGAVESGETA